MAGTTPGEMTQVIVLLVDRENPSDDREGIAAVAYAAARAHWATPDDPAWRVWMEEAMAKTVRRADAKTFEKLLRDFGDEAFHDQVGDAEALAFVPQPNDTLPKVIKRLQVSGTNLPRLDIVPESDDSVVEVLLNADLHMSTGKAAAQAAHAFVIRGWSPQLVDGAPRIRFAPAAELERAATEMSGNVIEDAGRTEIEPGSMTAVAYVHGQGAL